MAQAARFPEAIWLGNGVTYGAYLDGPFKIVLHTTETLGIPSYNNGGSAPHVTYSPRERKFYQHTEFTTSCGALRNESGGVQTNKDSALQLEIECYSAEWVVDQYGNGRIKASQVSEEAKQDIGRFVAFLCDEFGVEPELFYPELDYRDGRAYGVDSPTRMSGSVWDAFNGVCAHRNVPENTHWDTGALDVEGIIEYAKDYLVPKEDIELVLKRGDSGALVRSFQRALNTWAKANGVSGIDLDITGTFDYTTAKAVRKVQAAWGIDTTGQIDGLVSGRLSQYDPPVLP